MSDTTCRRLTRRLGMLSLASLLVAASAGLAYVAHLTQVTSLVLAPAQPPRVLPLVALSLAFAVGGLGTLKYAIEVDAEAV